MEASVNISFGMSSTTESVEPRKPLTRDTEVQQKLETKILPIT